MRIFLDFEFIENGNQHPIIPISVGMVREDGVEYYAEFSLSDAEVRLANPWVMDNVVPHLKGSPKVKTDIAKEIKEFVGPNPEFWGYYADYDWVILCHLYGDMMDLPEGWPMYCLDIKQFIYHLGLDKVPVDNSNEHHALADAHWNRNTFNWLLNYLEEDLNAAK